MVPKEELPKDPDFYCALNLIKQLLINFVIKTNWICILIIQFHPYQTRQSDLTLAQIPSNSVWLPIIQWYEYTSL
jgi:hypothetical protein